MTSRVIYRDPAMRGARLLHLITLLQNRGRMTTARLAAELEVSRRTILRDLDAMTEAGIPVVAFHGAGGGVELGFGYRFRWIALTGEEALALGVMLSEAQPRLAELGLATAARRAAGKMVESQPEPTRGLVIAAQERVALGGPGDPNVTVDPRLAALLRAVLDGRETTLRSRSDAPIVVHPDRLVHDGREWRLACARDGLAHPQSDWGDVRISAKRFRG